MQTVKVKVKIQLEEVMEIDAEYLVDTTIEGTCMGSQILQLLQQQAKQTPLEEAVVRVVVMQGE